LGAPEGSRHNDEALATKALSEFGRVDILINNAAIRPHKPCIETTDAAFERSDPVEGRGEGGVCPSCVRVRRQAGEASVGR
jgi:adenine-specific DNA methylase